MRAFSLISVLVVLLAVAVRAEEWYEPDSHLINESEFHDLVFKDKTAFKIVKYFSPHCGFCRFLKQVMDKLKHEKEWCFKIYDFNCAMHPQHCMQNVRSSSFPYTAIHNGEGELHEEIHGFYPEPVIRTIFDRIQGLCLELRQPKIEEASTVQSNSLQAVQEPKTQVPVQNTHTPVKIEEANNKIEQKHEVKPKERPIVPQVKEEKQQQVHENTKDIQNKLDEAKIPLQQQQIKLQKTVPNKQEAASISISSHSQKDEESSYLKYLIYGSTFLISIYYFHHINKGKELQRPNTHEQAHQQTAPLIQQNNKLSEQQNQVEQIIRQQSQLLAGIPDEQL